MACNSDCRKPSPHQGHCGVCHETFGSVTGFDDHRRAGVCVSPQSLSMVARDRVWRAPMTAREHDRLATLRAKGGGLR